MPEITGDQLCPKRAYMETGLRRSKRVYRLSTLQDMDGGLATRFGTTSKQTTTTPQWLTAWQGGLSMFHGILTWNKPGCFPTKT